MELDPKGPANSVAHEGITYEIHARTDTHIKVLAAFAADRLLWKVPIELGELLVRDMILERDPTTKLLRLTLDGEHWRGGTFLQLRYALAADGTLTELYAADELQSLSEAQRRAMLAALILAAGVDGAADPREIAVMRPLLEGAPWHLSNDAFNVELSHAQAMANASRTPKGVAELGRLCAPALHPRAKEKLLRLLFAIAWADGAIRPEEQWVLHAFVEGVGLPGERVQAIADESAKENPFAMIARGRIDAVRKLLDTGTPVGLRDAASFTLLHVAVATGQAAIVDLLLERGADVHLRHGQGSPPLFLACNKPYDAIVERLLRAGAKVDDVGVNGLTPLLIAAMFGQTKVARALRAGGAALEARDASERTPLHVAAAEGRTGTVAFLLAEGAVVDARTKPGCTPLMLAAENGSVATVAALLAAKAEVQATDIDQQTALHYAVQGNAPEVVALLLSFGAKVDATSSKQVTPLHVAAGAGSTTIARLLLDAGATVDAKNIEGGTPLFMAAVRDRRDVHELLVERGADLDAETSFKTTPRGSVGVGLAIKSLRSALLAEPLQATALRPDDATLAAHDDYLIAMWMNVDGTPDQVLAGGRDAKGRPQYVGRPGSGEARPRLLAVTDKSGRRWLPLFTSDAATDAFRKATPIGWPEDGKGFACAVTGTINAKIFAVGGLPIEGIVVNPYGPNGPLFLTGEECERVARRVA